MSVLRTIRWKLQKKFSMFFLTLYVLNWIQSLSWIFFWLAGSGRGREDNTKMSLSESTSCALSKHQLVNYRLSTLISFSRESSLPLSAFLSMTLMAWRVPGRSLLSARRTWEKAPLEKQREKTNGLRILHLIIIHLNISILAEKNK